MEPVLPDYSDCCVSKLVPALLGVSDIPSCFSEDIFLAKSIVLLVLDGLGWEQFRDNKKLFPALSDFSGDLITTVAPSTTATALTSITTGVPPGEHGIVGYRISIEGGILNSLRWSTGNSADRPDPYQFQLMPVFDNQQPKVVSSAEHEGSGFSNAHLRDTRFSGYKNRSQLVELIVDSVNTSEPFVYAYWDGVDRVAHEFGFTDRYFSELTECDQMIAELLQRLPSNVALVVTADHGQVEVEDRMIGLTRDLNDLVSKQSGEARFRWLHALPGMEEDLIQASKETFENSAWVMSQKEILEAGFLGPLVSERVRGRLGDVALLAREKIGFIDPAEKMPFELITRHGSLTKEEMHVPLLSAVT